MQASRKVSGIAYEHAMWGWISYERVGRVRNSRLRGFPADEICITKDWGLST